MSDSVTIVDALGWVYVRERQLLGVRSAGKDAFYLPGGKREPGESDWQALAREVREELQIQLSQASFQLLQIITAPAHGYREPAYVCLTCYWAEFEGQIAPDSEIEELVWLQYRDRDRCAPATADVLTLLFDRQLID